MSEDRKRLPRWCHFPHQADIGVQGEGATLAEAFIQAAIALTTVIVEPGKVNHERPVSIRCQAPDSELLLVDWLNAIIYEMSVRQMLFSRFELTIKGDELEGRAWGESVDLERHQPAVEIKGATYTELAVKQLADHHWIARCVVDV